MAFYVRVDVKEGDEGKRFNMVENDILKGNRLFNKLTSKAERSLYSTPAKGLPVPKSIGDKKFFISAEVKKVSRGYFGRMDITWTKFRNKDGSERKSRIPSSDNIYENFTIYSYEVVGSTEKPEKVITQKTKDLLHMLKTGEYIKSYTIRSLILSKGVNYLYETEPEPVKQLCGVIPPDSLNKTVREIWDMCYKNENDSVKKPLNIIDRIIISDKYNDEDKVELIDYLATQRGVDIGKSFATAAVLLSYPLLEKMLELAVDINEKFEYTHKSKTYNNISGFELAIYRTIYLVKVQPKQSLPEYGLNLVKLLTKRRYFYIGEDGYKFIKNVHEYANTHKDEEIAEMRVNISDKLMDELNEAISHFNKDPAYKDLVKFIKDIVEILEQERGITNAEPGGKNYENAVKRWRNRDNNTSRNRTSRNRTSRNRASRNRITQSNLD